MKAITLDGFGGADVMQYQEVSVPEVAQHQVLIQVHASSVNRPDIVQRQGNYPPPPGDSEILGLEVAGVVEKVGPGVQGLSEGDRVIALVGGGGYAEYAVAYATHCIPLPESISYEMGACLCETYITAYLNLFMIGELQDREHVLLHGGGGGVNTAAIQLCRALVPEAVIYVTASTPKLARVTELGAHHVIDYREQKFDAVIRELTAKRGVNVILDHIGAAYLDQNLACLSLSGRLLVIGVMGGASEKINLAKLMVKRQRIIGSVLRSRSIDEKAEIIRQFAENVIPLVADGTIQPLVSDTFPLEEAMVAHQTMESGSHFGKIVLTMR